MYYVKIDTSSLQMIDSFAADTLERIELSPSQDYAMLYLIRNYAGLKKFKIRLFVSLSYHKWSNRVASTFPFRNKAH